MLERLQRKAFLKRFVTDSIIEGVKADGQLESGSRLVCLHRRGQELQPLRANVLRARFDGHNAQGWKMRIKLGDQMNKGG